MLSHGPLYATNILLTSLLILNLLAFNHFFPALFKPETKFLLFLILISVYTLYHVIRFSSETRLEKYLTAFNKLPDKKKKFFHTISILYVVITSFFIMKILNPLWM